MGLNEGVGYRPKKSAHVGSRRNKAARIARLLGGEAELKGKRILEVGCGNGVITASLAALAGPSATVWGVDVVDRLQMREGFSFRLVPDTDLPFTDASFDVVVSNHVIEHVGSATDQIHHLKEIRRVLDPKGVCYLATPNRWAIWEPHFGLPFLSWLPTRTIQTRYVRLMRRADIYDCRLLDRRELQLMIGEAGLLSTNLTTAAIRLTLSRSQSGSMSWLPDRAFAILMPIVPTMVRTLRKVADRSESVK